MKITIRNCNNIDSGEVRIEENKLNIKYANNGTGKSTVAKAILAKVKEEETLLSDLVPFKYRKTNSSIIPSIEGIENVKSVKIFDENYVSQYVFQPDDVIKNTFEIFIKTPDYEANMNKIGNMLRTVNEAFNSHPELDFLISEFTAFIDGFGKAKGLSKSGAIAKGIAKGNKVVNVPIGLEAYAPYIKNTDDGKNVRWLKWQLEGAEFLEIGDNCPYCTKSVGKTKEMILKVGDEYNAKTIEHLNKMIEVFKSLMPYFSESTKATIESIINSSTELSEQQIGYLVEVKDNVSRLLDSLKKLKSIGYFNLKNVEKIYDEILSYKINLSLFLHMNSSETLEKVNVINNLLDELLEVASGLQGAVSIQKGKIKKSIEENNEIINNFMKFAGYQYAISIEEKENGNYKLVLTHLDNKNSEIGKVKNYLSYGERNALSLMLFMFDAIKENPDLIVLDDPISSFDGNKKFAILNILFMGKSNKCLKGRTVLLLTHEFGTIIDIVYNARRGMNNFVCADFLLTKNGILEESSIAKKDIKSFIQIAKNNIRESNCIIIKLIYIRRLLEVENCDNEKNANNAWNLLSNVFHKRDIPIKKFDKTESNMTQDEIDNGTEEIKKYCPDFNYDSILSLVKNKNKMIEEYSNLNSNYEKLQLYRIIRNENNENDVIRKFVNETYHIENDYVFQLNPRRYETIPNYVIEECDKDLSPLRNK